MQKQGHFRPVRIKQKGTHRSLPSCLCFGYVQRGCRSDYTGFKEQAFKATVVCFSSDLQDSRGFKGIKKSGMQFFFPTSFFLLLSFLSNYLMEAYSDLSQAWDYRTGLQQLNHCC